MYSKILCAVDLKSRSNKAFSHAVKLAHQFDSEIILLNVNDDFQTKEEMVMSRVSVDTINQKYKEIAISAKKELENLKENLEVDWLPTNAVIYKKNDKIYFDEFFSEYSYLEDLDFSYRKRKFGKLIVLKDAPCYNYNFIERKNFSFGVKELVNRYYFVKKNKLNIISFFFTSILKALSNLIRINLSQFTGNIIGLLKICLDYFLFKKL